MQDHALDPEVYIRSMASRGHLGGLSFTTPQAIRVLDAAGCDVVLVETVGVGQSEVEVAGLADTSVVLLAPGLGDRTGPGLWRPPGVKTVAAQKTGIDEVMEALDKHRAFIEENGELVRRRERRAAVEIETIALATLRSRFDHLGGHHGVMALAREVIAGRTDPYAAADRLLAQLGS